MRSNKVTPDAIDVKNKRLKGEENYLLIDVRVFHTSNCDLYLFFNDLRIILTIFLDYEVISYVKNMNEFMNQLKNVYFPAK